MRRTLKRTQEGKTMGSQIILKKYIHRSPKKKHIENRVFLKKIQFLRQITYRTSHIRQSILSSLDSVITNIHSKSSGDMRRKFDRDSNRHHQID